MFHYFSSFLLCVTIPVEENAMDEGGSINPLPRNAEVEDAAFVTIIAMI